MKIDAQALPALVFAVVLSCWFAFAAAFFLRQKPPKTQDRKKNRDSIIGVVLQGISYAIVWSIHRPIFTPMVANKAVEVALSTFAIAAPIGSVLLVMVATTQLGKQWSVTARLVEGHKLVTQGPYAVVRHPTYTGMMGMLVATGLAISHWVALLVAIVLFFVGTVIRVRSEEELLREAFGTEFEVYTRRVPAFIPGIF